MCFTVSHCHCPPQVLCILCWPYKIYHVAKGSLELLILWDDLCATVTAVILPVDCKLDRNRHHLGNKPNFEFKTFPYSQVLWNALNSKLGCSHGGCLLSHIPSLFLTCWSIFSFVWRWISSKDPRSHMELYSSVSWKSQWGRVEVGMSPCWMRTRPALC